MNNQWNSLFEGIIEGRPVKLLEYSSGELRVETTQKDTEIMKGSYEQNQTVIPAVFSEGDIIHIDAVTPEELQKELLECGFSESGAKDIARLAKRHNT